MKQRLGLVKFHFLSLLDKWVHHTCCILACLNSRCVYHLRDLSHAGSIFGSEQILMGEEQFSIVYSVSRYFDKIDKPNVLALNPL